MSFDSRRVRRKILFWISMISGGVLAYGLGLYQGSHYRMQRIMASEGAPVPVSLAKPEEKTQNSELKPSSKPVEPSNSPKSTQSPK